MSQRHSRFVLHCTALLEKLFLLQLDFISHVNRNILLCTIIANNDIYALLVSTRILIVLPMLTEFLSLR